jgi:hypothetical protein
MDINNFGHMLNIEGWDKKLPTVMKSGVLSINMVAKT